MLKWALCDLRGRRVAWLRDRVGECSVSLVQNGQRSATCGISTEDAGALDAIQALGRRLKVYSDGAIVCNGTLTAPHADLGAGVIQLNAADPGRQLESAFVQIPKPWKTYGFTRTNYDQGEILIDLVGHPPSAQSAAWAPGIPQHGIIRGSIIHSFPRTRNYESGKQIWAAMTELSQVIAGPDFELEPLDREDGVVARLNVAERLGTDKSGSVRLEYGLGRNNAGGFVYEPDGPGTVNRFTSLGQSEEGKEPPHYTSTQLESIAKYGSWEGFEGRPDIDEAPTVQEHAQRSVALGAFPVKYFTVVPSIQTPSGEFVHYDRQGNRKTGYGQPPIFGPNPNPSDPKAPDYWLGDDITAIGQDGNLKLVFIGQVIEAKLSEVDEAGNVQAEITCAPRITAAGVT